MTDVPPCYPAAAQNPLLTTTAALLNDAQIKYHALITGTQVVRVRDSNGEEVQYNLASADRLLKYIKTLQDVLNPSGRINGPMRVFF